MRRDVGTSREYLGGSCFKSEPVQWGSLGPVYVKMLNRHTLGSHSNLSRSQNVHSNLLCIIYPINLKFSKERQEKEDSFYPFIRHSLLYYVILLHIHT